MKTFALLSLVCFALILSSCNPECEPVFGLSVSPPVSTNSYEVLVTSSPVDAIKGRSVTFNGITAESEYIDKVGMRVIIPDGLSAGDAVMRIEDPDCGEIVITGSFGVVSPSNYFNSANFVFPSPPQIVIPTSLPSFPPSVANAWLSPQNTDYCLWLQFVPLTNFSGDSLILDENGNTIETATIDPSRSSELSVQELLGCNPNANTFYHFNPVSGLADKEKNVVHLWIDRSGRGLGIEELIGTFININDTPYAEPAIPDCQHPAGWKLERTYMMMVKSQQSGRTLLLYQQGAG